MAHKLEDLPIFHKAQEFCVAAMDALNRSRVRSRIERSRIEGFRMSDK
jgi:hypothetical protein